MKNIQFLLVLAILASVCLSTKTKTKSKSKSRFTNWRNKKQMPIKEIMRIVFQNQQEGDDEKKAAAKADALFSKQSKGRDESETATATGEIQMRIMFKFAGPNEEDRTDLTKLSYIINSRMLYFLDTPDSYRGINSGIDLAQVVSITDDCQNGQCCQRIKTVSHVEIKVYDFTGYCFHLDMPTENYLFCLEDQDELKSFRDKLTASVMSAWFLKQGISAPNFVQDEGAACLNPEFNWSEESQQSWPCQCNKGLKQSPIDIDPSTVIEMKDDRLKFEFNQAQAIRYGVVRREPEFYADFGQFSHITPEKTIKYIIDHISFKAKKPEHTIKGSSLFTPMKGELEIFGQSVNRETAILSILFVEGDADNNKDGKTNLFMDYMNLDQWVNYNFNEMDANDQPVMKCLKMKPDPKYKDSKEYLYPNLKDFIKSDKVLDGDYSFYFYQGSESKPPCSEKVTRYVMQNPAKIDSANMKKLVTKVIKDGQVAPKAQFNIRAKQNLFARDVYYHKASTCSTDAVKKKPSAADSSVDYKFIKATQKYKIFAVADHKFPIKKVFDYHASKTDRNKIVVNDNLKLTKFPKYPEFNKAAGEDTIEVLKQKWLDQIGPFPEPTVSEVNVLDETLKNSGVDDDEDKKDKKKKKGEVEEDDELEMSDADKKGKRLHKNKQRK